MNVYVRQLVTPPEIEDRAIGGHEVDVVTAARQPTNGQSCCAYQHEGDAMFVENTRHFRG